MTEFSTLIIERRGHVAIVTVSRPEKLNALNRQVLLELAEAFAILARDTSVRAAILTGAGKAFVAGADIASMATMTVAEARAFSQLGHRVGEKLEEAPFPVIAAVNGYALGGGCELALCCDFIYASHRAKFGQPEVKLGLMPGFGGTTRLARRIGLAKASELIFTGDMIDAAQARELGLVNLVTEPEALIDRALETAHKIAKMAPLAIAASKRSLRRGFDVELSTANAFEREAFSGLFGSADQREGTRCFLEKREPDFTGT